MALSLPGERSLAAATPANPFAAFARWIAKAKAARTRRIALSALLELDHARLNDLGISRDDITAALAASRMPHRSSTLLAPATPAPDQRHSGLAPARPPAGASMLVRTFRGALVPSPGPGLPVPPGPFCLRSRFLMTCRTGASALVRLFSDEVHADFEFGLPGNVQANLRPSSIASSNASGCRQCPPP